MLPFQHLDPGIIFCTGQVLREEVPSKQKDTSETRSCPLLISAVPGDRLAVVSRQEPQAEMRSRGEGWREGGVWGSHLVGVVKAVIHEPRDQRRLSDCKTKRREMFS